MALIPDKSISQNLISWSVSVENSLKVLKSLIPPVGINKIVVIPKLTVGGTDGKITIKNGIVIDAIDPT